MLKKGAVLLAAMFTLMAAAACTGGGGQGEIDGGGQGGIEQDAPGFPFAAYRDLPEVRLSSFYTLEAGEVCHVKMRAPFTDAYEFSFSSRVIEQVKLFDEQGEPLAEASENFEVSLKKGQLVYVDIFPKDGVIRLDVKPSAHKAEQPFSVAQAVGPEAPLTSSDPTADPMVPAEIEYVKRPNTLYVYCNAPEALTEGPHVINHCITRQDVSGQSVFFTMEQQSDHIKPGVYYGYRVRNTGKNDLYVTVKNIGYQRFGPGAYLGEEEWTQFYNTKFRIPDFGDLNESQKKNWKDYFDFSGTSALNGFVPTTYRIPAGEYIYVFGGTTEDAYGKFNVAKTADRRVDGNCQNGAVLFDVIGEAEGAYYVYDDYRKVLPGTEGGDDHLGITDPAAYGVVHCGEDVGYVVDNQASWVFNDVTPAGKLPVTFKNYYMDDVPEEGEPGAKIPSTEHIQTLDEWVTHINVQGAHEAVGTDMTSFHTLFNKVKDDGVQLPITVGCDWYDSRGKLANIGNWMKDYQDLFIFTNQGDTERQVTVNINCTGAMCTLVRDLDGNVIKGTELFAFQRGSDSHGEGYDKAFHYTVKIPAHTTVKFVAEYNLMANSTGYVRHSVDLA